MSESFPQLPRLLRPSQIATALSISRGQVYKLIHSGQIHAVFIAGSVRVPEEELGRLIRYGTAPGEMVAAQEE